MKITGSIKIYSFDIFDTCLTRTFVQPTDLFHELGRLFLSQIHSHYATEDNIRYFAQLRQRAESNARRQIKNIREDIQLQDIYHQLQRISPWQFDIEEVMALEMALEKRSLKPILPIQKKIASLRQEGHRVIFISDMYLPSKFIKQCLVDHQIATSADTVYVSGEVGLSKHHGSLFKHVLQHENIGTNDIIHCGDNLHSDVNVPQRLGIKTVPFNKINLSRYEQLLCQSKTVPIELSKLAAHGRIVRLSHTASLDRDINGLQLMSGVIGPILISFTAWVLRTAKAEGIDRLYFVSRDGQILYKIALELLKFMSAPECRYLYGSRQAWFLPSVTTCDAEHLDWLLLPGRSTAIKDILARLNLCPADIAEQLTEAGFATSGYDIQLSGDELEHFKHFLFNTPSIISVVEEKAKASRTLVAKYFEQEQLNDGSSWAIVDIGWRLNCQQALKRIIEALGWPCQPKGLYFGLANDHLPSSKVGWHKAYLSSQDTLFWKRGLLIEHAFTPATHPPVIGYSATPDGVVPIFKTVDLNKRLIDYTKLLHSLCVDYARDTAQSGLWTQQNAFLDEKIKHAANKFLSFPTKADVIALNWMSVILDQVHEDHHSQSLAKRISGRHVLDLIGHEFGLKSTLPQGTYWLEGAAALSSFHIRTMLYGLLLLKRSLQRLK